MKNVYASRTRRDFLTTAVGGGALVLGPARLSAVGDAVDTHVSQAMSGTIGIDMHNHVYPAGPNRIRGMVSSNGRRSNSGLPIFS